MRCTSGCELIQLSSRWHGAIDSGQFDNQISRLALWRLNRLFAGLFNNGKRAAVIKSKILSVRMNGLDTYVSLKDVLIRMPT